MSEIREDLAAGPNGRRTYRPLGYDELNSRIARRIARHYQIGRAIPPEVSSYLSSEVMKGTPSRRQAYDRLLDELAQVCPWTIDTVLMSLIDAFACWVVELPTSKRFHHRGPFGLVCHASSRFLQASAFEIPLSSTRSVEADTEVTFSIICGPMECCASTFSEFPLYPDEGGSAVPISW